MQDKKIIELLFERDEAGIDLARECYGKTLLSAANRILKDKRDSEECLSDTLLALWNTVPPKRPQKLGAFMLKLNRNLAIKKMRDNSAQKRGGGALNVALCELEECIASDKDINSEIEEKRLAEIINNFLLSIDENERKMFVLRYFHFYSIKELCSHFGYGASRVKTTLLRTRKKLLIKLEKEGVLI